MSDDETHHATAKPRSAELTRPLKLSRLEIISAIAVTAAMFGVLGLGIGRETLGFQRDVAPARVELKVASSRGDTPAFQGRGIAITPDGSAVVFQVETEDGEDAVAFQQINSKTPVVMDQSESVSPSRISDNGRRVTGFKASDVVEARFAAGHLFYVRPGGTMWAAPFDEEKKEITSAPVQIASGVGITEAGVAQFAVSKNGSVAYLPYRPRSLVLVSPEGRLRFLTNERRGYSSPRFSPDGKRIAVDFTDSLGRDVWTASVDSGTLRRATFVADAHDAAWMPDGKSITFTSFRLGKLGIYRSRPGIDRPPDSLFTSEKLAYSGEWLKDASGLVTAAKSSAQHSTLDIAFVGNAGRGPLVPVIADRFDKRFASVSSDGNWVAYVSNQTGGDEVYIRRWTGAGPVVRVSSRGGTEPRWSPDGTSLFYRESATQYLTAASIRVDSSVSVTASRRLFPLADIVAGVNHANYDVSPDGNTFVMIRRPSSDGIMVLQNVPAMLRDAKKR